MELPDFSDKNILNFYIHCFKVGVRSIPDSRIQSVWDDYFQKNNFPSDQKWIGDGQMYVYVSKAYKTMFEKKMKPEELGFIHKLLRIFLNGLVQNLL